MPNRSTDPAQTPQPDVRPEGDGQDEGADLAADFPPAPMTTSADGPAPVTSVPEAKALTKKRARDLGSMLTRYVRRHLPPPTPKPQRPQEPPKMVGTHARWLPVLRVIPVLLVILFAVSLAWDFEGLSATAFGRTLPLEGLLLTLSVSGLIGFLTNWLAITMLFRPREKRPIFPQGLIPAQRERVVYRLAKAVSDELINAEIIAQKIRESGVIPKYRKLALDVTRGVVEDPEFRAELRDLTASYAKEVLGSPQVRQRIVDFTVQKLEEHAKEGLSGIALKVYRFVNEEDFQRRIEEAVAALPESVDVALDETDVLLDRLPEKIEARSEDIEALATKVVLGFVENLDVYAIIVGNMHRYDEAQLERLLKNTSNEQLNYIKYLGGVLGLFGGLVIWQPLLALGAFTALGVSVYLLDEALYRAGKS